MIRLATAALGAAFLLARSAAAEPLCGPREAIAASISGPKYAEQLVGRGAQGGLSVELWLSASGTFSVLAIFDGGRACLIAAGRDWQFFVPTFGDPA